jgi:hypothetical protein
MMNHGVKMATDCMSLANASRNGRIRFTLRGRERTARMKATTGWNINRIGWFTF